MAIPTDQEILEHLVNERRVRIDRWTGLYQRMFEMNALINDQWQTVFPDDISDNDLPMVANGFKTHIEDVGHLFGEDVPNVRVDPESGYQRALHRSERRERILNGYIGYSDLWAAREYFGMDMAAAGLTAIKVWPNFRKPIAERFPVYTRLDPRNLLPEPRWNPTVPTDNMMLTYKETVTKLKEQFPIQVELLLEAVQKRLNETNETKAKAGRLNDVQGIPFEFDVIDWYSTSYFARAAVCDMGEVGYDAVILATTENVTGLCPIQIAPRTAWSFDPSGLMDSVKGIVRTKNRFWRIMLDYFVEMVYGGKLVWNVQNPHAKGPHVRYIALGPDSKMETVTPAAPAFQVMQILQILEGEAEGGSMDPASRRGEVDLNKATAAFLTKAQGQLSSLVKSIKSNFATALQRANEFAFAADEAWCNAQKEITGRARGRRFQTTYTPKEAIAGDYANSVRYGALSGIDHTTAHVMLSTQFQAGALPLEIWLANNPFVEDVPEALSQITEDALNKAFLAALQEAAPIAPAAVARARQMIEESKTLGEIATEVGPMLQQATQAALPGAPGGGPALPTPGAPPGLPVEGASIPGPLPSRSLVRSLGRR